MNSSPLPVCAGGGLRLKQTCGSEAQFKLGDSFYDGFGVKRDDSGAAVRSRRAADRNHAEAQRRPRRWVIELDETGDGEIKKSLTPYADAMLKKRRSISATG